MTEAEKAYLDHLDKAQEHARQAHDALYEIGGVKRSLWTRLMLGRAQSILMTLLVRELSRKDKE